MCGTVVAQGLRVGFGDGRPADLRCGKLAGGLERGVNALRQWTWKAGRTMEPVVVAEVGEAHDAPDTGSGAGLLGQCHWLVATVPMRPADHAMHTSVTAAAVSRLSIFEQSDNVLYCLVLCLSFRWLANDGPVHVRIPMHPSYSTAWSPIPYRTPHVRTRPASA